MASDLLTLQALNAARLKEAGAVDASFVSRTINDKPLNLGQGIWLNDSTEGNLAQRRCRQPRGQRLHQR